MLPPLTRPGSHRNWEGVVTCDGDGSHRPDLRMWGEWLQTPCASDGLRLWRRAFTHGICPTCVTQVRKREQMGFLYTLRLADGDDAGTFDSTSSSWSVGDTLIADGNRRYKVTAIVPLEKIAEFVDDATYGLLEVEAL